MQNTVILFHVFLVHLQYITSTLMFCLWLYKHQDHHILLLHILYRKCTLMYNKCRIFYLFGMPIFGSPELKKSVFFENNYIFVTSSSIWVCRLIRMFYFIVKIPFSLSNVWFFTIIHFQNYLLKLIKCLGGQLNNPGADFYLNKSLLFYSSLRILAV